jgi:peroxiredoxin
MMSKGLKWTSILIVLGFTVTIIGLKPSYAEGHFEKHISALKLYRFKSSAGAPAFTLKDEKGENISLADYKGRVVLLNFWATWCVPCRTEMPDMVKLYDKFKDRGFVILAVDQQEDAQRVAKFKAELGINFPTAVDETGRVGLRYGVRALPTTYVIDRLGRTLAGAVGIRDWNSKEAYNLIESLLEPVNVN